MSETVLPKDGVIAGGLAQRLRDALVGCQPDPRRVRVEFVNDCAFEVDLTSTTPSETQQSKDAPHLPYCPVCGVRVEFHSANQERICGQEIAQANAVVCDCGHCWNDHGWETNDGLTEHRCQHCSCRNYRESIKQAQDDLEKYRAALEAVLGVSEGDDWGLGIDSWLEVSRIANEALGRE